MRIMLRAAVQACYAEGKRYGVPVAVETNALFYNTDKIKELPQLGKNCWKWRKNREEFSLKLPVFTMI